MNDYYVYIYLNPLKKGSFSFENLKRSFIYEPFYVGKGRGKRYKDHILEAVKDDKYKNSNKHKINTIKKIMKTGQNPIVVFFKESISNEESIKIEKLLIKEIGRCDLGYGTLTNMTDGGEGISGFNHTNSTKRKLSKSRKALGIAKGKNNPMFGNTVSLETKEKMRATFKEHYKKENHPNYGKRHLEETKMKISKTKREKYDSKGKNNPMYGKNHTQETKAKMREASLNRIKKYIFINPSGIEYVVERKVEFINFCKKNKLNEKKMRYVLNGTAEDYKGWKVVYA